MKCFKSGCFLLVLAGLVLHQFGIAAGCPRLHSNPEAARLIKLLGGTTGRNRRTASGDSRPSGARVLDRKTNSGRRSMVDDNDDLKEGLQVDTNGEDDEEAGIEEDHNESGNDDDDDENDDENDEDETEDESEDENDDRVSDKKSRKRRTQKKAARSSSSIIGSASDLANMALKFTRGSVKAAADLCANKHVTLVQIAGKWRIQQEIEVRKGVFVACPATIQLLEDGSVITTCDGQVYKSEFVFKERAWPRKCTISFQARAFQGAKDKEPVAMFYKGYFKRSIMNPNVVLIRGKIYRLSGKLFFKKQERCGRFKASKRRYN